MKDFAGRIAVLTGGGSGMGRELARQLAAEGCHLAICDVSAEGMQQTAAACRERARAGTRLSCHACDVSDEAQVLAFRDAVVAEHQTDHVDLLFNNAGIGGGGSLFEDAREHWDKTFAVCWGGVYFCTRAFLPLLVASDAAHLVNTSSVNGFWASLGPLLPHTAYSAAKFAVKGFSEALINDLRLHAPHVKVSVVMPGHVGTSILANSAAVLGRPSPKEMSAEDLLPVRDRIERMGLPRDALSDDQLRQLLADAVVAFRERAPLSAAEAATRILDGVREERWRILVGEDAVLLDRLVREAPEEAYEPGFMERLRAHGAFAGIELFTPGSEAPRR